MKEVKGREAELSPVFLCLGGQTSSCLMHEMKVGFNESVK